MFGLLSARGKLLLNRSIRWCIFVSVDWLIIGWGNDFRLCCDKPLHEPMKTYCQLHPWERNKLQCSFNQNKAIWAGRHSTECRPFCHVLNMLTHGFLEIGQHLFRLWIAAWRHQAFTWQCWLLIRDFLRHLPEIKFTVSVHVDILYKEFENHTFEITVTPQGAMS